MAEASERPTRLPRLEPGSVFAGYRIQHVIDRGGMGVVYKATDPDLDRAIALKIIAPEYTQDETAVARFKAEARVAASLEHPNIVPIHRGGAHDGILYLAMRYVAGSNLRGAIDGAPMQLPRVAKIVADVASALDVAHGHGLVHRDVKPANILLCGEGNREQVYLTDFGLTKRLGSSGDLTRPGAWVGTPDYVAPEQIHGREVDGRADVYSLGCVLYEMLTGHVAYPKDSDVAKLWAHVSDPPPLPRSEAPHLVQAFDDVVARATAKDPDDRYGSAGEFAAAVRDAAAEQQTHDQDRAGQAGQPLGATGNGSLSTRGDEVFVDERADRHTARGLGPAPDYGPPIVAPPPARQAHHARGGGGAVEEPWLRRRRWPVAAAIAVLACAAAAVILLSSGSSTGSKTPSATGAEPKAASGRRISGGLTPVPTNRVKGSGSAVVRLDGTVATVSLTTNNLVDGPPHALHIHAGARGQCPSARAAKVHNGHLSIATKSGVPFYGHALTALTTRGNTDPERSLLAFKRYPSTGSIRYSRKIDVGPVVASYLRKDNAVVVVHGIDYNHNGIYDGTLDRSDLDRSLPGEATAPGLCGVLIADKGSGSTGKAAPGNKTGQAPSLGKQVFAATLVNSASGPRPPVWRCRLDPNGAELS
jgi:serine/threonine protein kinase